MDYTLKFTSEAAANAVLFTDQTQVMGDVVETVKVSNFPGHAVDIIGIIYKPTGKLLDGDYPEMAAVPGWHANVRGPENAALAEHHIIVNTPVRGWA